MLALDQDAASVDDAIRPRDAIDPLLARRTRRRHRRPDGKALDLIAEHNTTQKLTSHPAA